MKSSRKTVLASALAATLALAIAGCTRSPAEGGGQTEMDHGAEGGGGGPTNRVDIPVSVRRNLGITFAKVQKRNVAKTVRYPGRFELLPTARREHRAPLAGRVELLVAQYETVEEGRPLYRLDSPAWRELLGQIAATHSERAAAVARLESMPPLREAHARHEQALVDKVKLWEERLKSLAELTAAGGGSAARETEARATLNLTQAELADVMEDDARLEADEREARAIAGSAAARLDLLVHSAASLAGMSPEAFIAALEGGGSGGAAPMPLLEVRATGDGSGGVVDVLGITSGGYAEESALILSTVRPDLLRFRARAPQADLPRLRDGLPTVVAPSADEGRSGVDAGPPMTGVLTVAPLADADGRTIDLITTPAPGAAARWAKAGVAAYLEVTLEGGAVELAVPAASVIRDGTKPILFRRDPKDPDKVIRMEADVGLSDGRWVVIASGVKEGDEVVLDGVYQLMLATSNTAAKGGHFHPDGTFHEEEH